MRGVIGTMSLALGALVMLSVGMFLASAIGIEVRRVFGREYELYGFWGTVLVLAAIAAALYRWQDAILGWIEPIVGRGAPELLFCQVCGYAVLHDSVLCRQCGGHRFGIAKPYTGTEGAGPASRWHVQVGMDVIDRDGAGIGVVRRKRRHDFLVARPRRRDVYVPMNAIARAGVETVQLEVTIADLNERARAAWARPRLFGRGEVGGPPAAT